MAQFDAVFSVYGEDPGAYEHVPPIEDILRVSSSHKDAHDDGDLKFEQMLQQTFTGKVSKIILPTFNSGNGTHAKFTWIKAKSP